MAQKPTSQGQWPDPDAPGAERSIAALRRQRDEALARETALTDALDRRTAELREALDYQAAASDVLKVISRSTSDLGPVFEAVVATAARLCRADQAAIYRNHQGTYRWAVRYSNTPEYDRIERVIVIRPGQGTLVGRVALQGRAVQIPDAWTDPLYEAKADARVGGFRTLLGVPLLRDGVPIEVIGLARRRIEPYTEAQVQLVSTFADQAVIAIENTRLFTEQREALEQQTATSEVLQVINGSPGNLAPVFDAMLEKAMRLCGAMFGILRRFDAGQLSTLATRGVPRAYAEFTAQNVLPLMPGSTPARAIESCGDPGKAVSAILHHQAGRRGNRARAIDHLRHRHQAARWHDRGRQRAGQLRRVHRGPAVADVHGIGTHPCPHSPIPVN